MYVTFGSFVALLVALNHVSSLKTGFPRDSAQSATLNDAITARNKLCARDTVDTSAPPSATVLRRGQAPSRASDSRDGILQCPEQHDLRMCRHFNRCRMGVMEIKPFFRGEASAHLMHDYCQRYHCECRVLEVAESQVSKSKNPDPPDGILECREPPGANFCPHWVRCRNGVVELRLVVKWQGVNALQTLDYCQRHCECRRARKAGDGQGEGKQTDGEKRKEVGLPWGVVEGKKIA